MWTIKRAHGGQLAKHAIPFPDLLKHQFTASPSVREPAEKLPRAPFTDKSKVEGPMLIDTPKLTLRSSAVHP